jgi:hypothetical protein
MKNLLRTLPLLALGLLVTVNRAQAQSGTLTGTTTVSVTIGPQAGLTITNSSTPLTAGGSNFGAFTGTTGLNYYVRTSQTGGSGTITMKVTTDFSPANGPSVATPPTAGDALTYTCTAAGPGTGCTGTQTASTSSQTNLVSFGADVHTTTAGSTASTAWSLTNDPKYKTGTYSATITYTISAS